ncbi:MAG: OmpA family protein [Undibacterium sp.]|nr:OmpA family protein [Undibacterium sp.]
MKTPLIFFVLIHASALCSAQTDPANNSKPQDRQQEYIRALTPPSRNLIINSVNIEKPSEPPKLSAPKPETAKPPVNAANIAAPPKAEANWKPSWQPDYQKAMSSIDLAIQFEFNSNRIKPESMKMLEDLAMALNSKELQGIRFLVEGHTDGVGSNSYNMRLSQMRADQVKGILVSKRVASKRLKSVGKGFSEPINATDIQSPENRRVRIISMEK